MQNVLSALAGAFTGEGSGSSRKKQKTTVGVVNVVLRSEDEGSSQLRELLQKWREDRTTSLSDVVATVAMTTVAIPPAIPFPPASQPS